MSSKLLHGLNLPSSCKISKKLFKKQFIENFSLNSSEKKVLSNDVESMSLEYLLNKDNINISPYSDDDKEYAEIAFIAVELSNPDKLKSITHIIQNIPYPLILFCFHKQSVCINISPKRLNQNDSNKLVVEESIFTKWIDLEVPTELEEKFLESLKVHHHPFTNFHAFYTSYLDKIVAFNASKHSGELKVTSKTKEVLAHIHETEIRIADIASKIKKETSLKEKVNLNIALKSQNDTLERLKTALQSEDD